MVVRNVLAKISAVLPEDLRHQLEFSGLLIGPVKTAIQNDDEKEALIRHAIRKEYKLQSSSVAKLTYMLKCYSFGIERSTVGRVFNIPDRAITSRCTAAR